MAAAFAFLHHLAAFALVAALAVEFALVRGELTLRSARALRVADLIYGVSAGILLVVGLYRVFALEKGADYYINSGPFIAKFALFALVGLASLYPTIEFLSWKTPLANGHLPTVNERKLGIIRRIIHWELAGITVILLCAALMARGIGMLQ